MLLTHLSLAHFRRFARLDLEVPGGLILLVGANAEGKTSLLEAIYYLATFTSFHAAQDRQMMSFWEARKPLAVTRVQGEFRTQGEAVASARHRLEARLILQADEFGATARFRREVLMDGREVKASEVVGFFKAVLFQPQMLRVIEGAPEDRRRFLDLAMSQVVPHLTETYAAYQRLLKMRNALLRRLAEQGGDMGQLDPLDEELARTGGILMQERIKAVQALERIAAQVHFDLTQDMERIRLVYLPSFNPLAQNGNPAALPLMDLSALSRLSLEELQQGYRQALKKGRGIDLSRGVTTLGPHRDDLRFYSNQIDLGLYGSRGQARTAMLTLKLAELTWIRQATGQWPVLLLDEMLAELDPDRRRNLLRRLLECEQVLLTTTDLDLFPAEFVRQTNLWRLSEGSISAL